MQRLYSVLIFLFLSLSSTTLPAAFTEDPALHWKTLHTPHFQIHFHDGELDLAKELAQIAERVQSQLSEYLQWTPAAPTEIILNDRVDYSNGWSTPFPRNTIELNVNPPDDVSTLEDYNNWLELVFTHEYTHTLHLDSAFGGPAVIRKIFGRIATIFPNAFPNALQPYWVLEGLATYIETDPAKGIGRGQNTSYKALMRVEVENGIKPIYQVNQPMVSWPAGTARYLYGVYFMNFVRDRYGDKQLRNWIHQYGNNFFWFINMNARHTLGKNLNPLWQEFSQYLQDEFQPTINEIKAAGVTEGVNISKAGYYTGYPRALPNGDVYYIRDDFASHTKLMVLKNGAAAPQVVTNVDGERFDIHPSAGILMARLELNKSVNVFSDLYRISFKGHETRLTKGKRYTYAAWSPDATQIIAVHSEAGQKALHLLSAKGEFIDTLWQGENKEVISELDWSPDGKSVVAAVWRPESRWNLEEFSLQTKTWHKLTQTDFIETQPRYTADGKSVIFCADYSGVFNVMRMNRESGKIVRLTNLVGGAYAVTPQADGNGIFYMGLSAKGYDVYHLTEVHQQPVTNDELSQHNTSNINGPLDDIKADTTYSADNAKISNYNGISKIAPAFWYPAVGTDSDNNTVVEVTTFGWDPLQRHNYSLLFGYHVNKEFPYGQFDYVYDRWTPSLKFSIKRDPSYYYDSDNKLKRIRVDDSVSGEIVVPFLKFDRQWAFHLGLVHDRESDQWTDKNVATQASRKDQLAGLAISYNSAQYYPKAISLSDGQQFRVVGESSDVFNSDYSGQIYTLDWRGYQTLSGQHVLSARLVGGYGTDDPRPFHLGGYNNGYYLGSPGGALAVPTTEIFGKRDYALRGYKEIPELIGRRMALAELEWRFPIAFIERGWMSPPLGIHDIYGKVFYNAGETWQDKFQSSDLLQGAGFEFNTQFVIGYAYGLNLRLGYAHGFDSQLGEDTVYASVGGTF